jgi:heme A synthase
VSVPSPGFRKLAFWTGIATLLLIIVGGIVRVSQSGLGCGPAGSGLHGWPFCNGEILPAGQAPTFIEYSHRTVAGIVGLLFLALMVWIWRRYRDHRDLFAAGVLGFVLVVAQGLLGALTVEHNLDPGLVAAHLGMAMILLALAAYIWRGSRDDVVGAEPVDGGPRFKGVALASQIGLFLTIVAGGYMAGTQKFGRTDFDGSGAHHACGTQFPSCNGAFMPFGDAPLVDIHLTHRLFLYVTAILIVWLAVMAIRRAPTPRLVRMGWVALAMLLAQLLVGALNVWIPDILPALIVLHLTLATVLWGHVFGINLQLYRVPEPLSGPAASRAGTVAA